MEKFSSAFGGHIMSTNIPPRTWHGGSRANCNVRDDDIRDKVCHQQLITQLNTEDNLFPCCYQLLMTTNVDIQPF